MQLLRAVLHNQDTGNTALQFSIESIYINTVFRRLGIHLVGNGIPVQCTFGILQLSCLTQDILHQEVRNEKPAHAVTVVVDIAPAAAIGNALVGNMVVHGKKLPFQFISHAGIQSIVIGYGDALHQVEVFVHLHAQPGKHIFIPIRYHTFISLRLPDHKNR